MSHSKQPAPPQLSPKATPKGEPPLTIAQRRAEVVDVLVQALLTKLFADSAASRASSWSARRLE
jgi:hypothetical protein